MCSASAKRGALARTLPGLDTRARRAHNQEAEICDDIMTNVCNINACATQYPFPVLGRRLPRPVRLPSPLPRSPQRASSRLARLTTLYVPFGYVSTRRGRGMRFIPRGRRIRRMKRHRSPSTHPASRVRIAQVQARGYWLSAVGRISAPHPDPIPPRMPLISPPPTIPWGEGFIQTGEGGAALPAPLRTSPPPPTCATRGKMIAASWGRGQGVGVTECLALDHEILAPRFGAHPDRGARTIVFREGRGACMEGPGAGASGGKVRGIGILPGGGHGE